VNAHRPRKRFGQHFLIDERIVDRIVAAVAPRAGDFIVEIGPGREALTGPLAASGAELTVVELDRELAARLVERHPDLPVLCADALRVDYGELAAGRPYRLVGNLPYNISTPLLFHLLAQRPPPEDMHFMLQQEVVERMCAGPGGKARGRLSLACENLARVEPLFGVPPDAFEPPPRVDSAVVRVVPHGAPRVPPDLADSFDRIVSRAFSQRRKTLRNSLRGLLDTQALERARVDPANRPERLTLEQFRSLAEQL
jgi:16S rRNA (adenine1518-N6/adenine1519-N6)-dimethyltransferase